MSHQRPKVELVSLQRNHDKIVLWDSEHGALHGFDANDAIRQTFDINFAADQITGGEEFRRNVRANVGHPRRTFGFQVGKEPAKLDVAIIDVRGIRRGAANENILEQLVAAFHFCRRAARFCTQLSN